MLKTYKARLIIYIYLITFFYIFLLTILHDFSRDRKPLKVSDDEKYNLYLKELLTNKTDTIPQVLAYDKKHLKNLILIQLESFPFELINKKISPNLYNLSQLYEFIGPINVQPYSTWTTGGVVLTQCGIPQILPDSNWRFRLQDKFMYNKNIACLSDILGSIGYNKLFALTGTERVMGFGEWRKFKNFTKISKTKNDLKLSCYIADEVLPILDNVIRGKTNSYSQHKTNKKKRKQNKTSVFFNITNFNNNNNNSRYLLYIRPEDTHIPYLRPKWCTLNNSHLERHEKCFNCVDFAINKIIQKFLDLKMQEHSVLAVYPDHAPFGREFPIENNRLFILFPGIQKINQSNKINRSVTYYDFAPTILDMIGIKDYLPKYPFGNNIYNNKIIDDLKHDKPDGNDLDIIDSFLNFFQPKLKKFKCYPGYHKYKQYYYSDKPCNYTAC